MENVETNLFDYDRRKFQEWLNSEYYQKKLEDRLKINDSCLRNRDSQVLTYQLCRDDPIFFIENFGWTFDPRPQHEPHYLPFILYEFQKDVIRWLVKHIQEGQDGYLEKSRDMGITYLVVWVYYWFWRFSPTFSGLVGSYKEALVDNRTKDSLFGMLDFCIENTPKWLIPARFKPKEHRQKLKLTNSENHNLISGDTMNPNFSRGSRKNVVVFDEAASWQYFRESFESAGDTTPCRIAISTPKGRNAAALLRESGIDVLTIHWKLHPLKDDTWYSFQKERRTEEEIAQELDISYHKSQTGRVYPEWDDVEYGFYPYDSDLPLFVSWDFGFSDQNAMIWWQPTDKIRIVDSYSNHGKIIDFYVPFITGITPSDDYKYNKKDFEVIESHKNWKWGIHFGDPAGRFTNQVVNKSVMDVLKQYGIMVNYFEDMKDFQSRKTQTKLLLKNVVVNDNPRTKELGLAMENARYPQIVRGGMEDIRSIKPIHDWTSHYRSSVEYFCTGYAKIKSKANRIVDKFPVRVGTGTKRIIAY